ncbi:hypothetical protein HY571_02580 [Candidatus Micrarchaeota archaeon]|nr:hypothetical protein [Candidatus Micrarchaeota archaeon]
MDFTFLFLTILMLLAAQSGMLWIAAGLFLLLLLSAKTHLLLIAAGVAFVLLALIGLGLTSSNYVIMGGLFVVLVILVKKDADSPQQPDPMAMYGAYGG